MVIVTFGTEGRTVHELTTVAARHVASLVVDVRRMPDKDREFAPAVLDRAFGRKYRRIRELAVTNLRSGLASGQPPQFVHLSLGLRALGRAFDGVSVPVVLLVGDAPDPMQDARGHLADGLARDLHGVRVIHDRVEANGTQVALW